MAFYKRANLALRSVPLPALQKEAGRRLEVFRPHFAYFVVDGLDGDAMNANADLYPYHDAAYCRHCDLYLMEMALHHGAVASDPRQAVQEFCPLCRRPLDGGLLHKNSEGVVGHETWRDKPVCVQHFSSDQSKHYGRIHDTRIDHDQRTAQMLLGVDTALLERDHPGLLEAYQRGVRRDVSQGCRVAFSLCSKCRHLARNEDEYCACLRTCRGRLVPVEPGDRPYPGLYDKRSGLVRVGEICCDLTGIEESLVSQGACDAAKVLDQLHFSEGRSVGSDLGGDLRAALASPARLYGLSAALAATQPLRAALAKAAAVQRAQEILRNHYV